MVVCGYSSSGGLNGWTSWTDLRVRDPQGLLSSRNCETSTFILPKAFEVHSLSNAAQSGATNQSSQSYSPKPSAGM
jgi:hypothetical protein